VETQLVNDELVISHYPEAESVYFAYFAPYSYERHMDLLHQAQSSGMAQIVELGETLDGRDMSMLVVGEPADGKKKIWITARQHPGESMAEWFVEGLLPLNQTDFKVKAAIPDPEELMAMEFTTALKQSGIDVKFHHQMMRKQLALQSAHYDNAKLIMEYSGKDVNNIAHWVNQRSVNLFAEHLLCLLALKKYRVGNTSNGVQALLDFWKGKIDLSTIRLTDGSGLSRSNTVAASHFTQLLSWMSKNGSKEFEKSLPIAGKTGTLANVAKNQAAHGRVLAKSGTMSRVKSYAGYVNSKSGKKLAFAIIVNNHTNSSAELTKQIATLFNAMASF
jgi:D-alanyl-D-alanine carboxypeptidase/D-alanyl-D-alanine-endopeptidase (penicillin-binding protein 4)